MSRLPQGPIGILAELACSFANLVHVPVDIRTPARIVNEYVSSIQPAAIAVIDESRACAGTNLHSIKLLSRFTEVGLERSSYKSKLPTDPARLGTILFTSGTTRGSKGVMLSHRNLMSNARGKLSAMPQYATDIRLNFLPWTHAYARTCELSTWAISGCALASVESLEAIRERTAQLSPTLINGVPAFYQWLYQQCMDGQGRLDPEQVRRILGNRIRMLGSGGAGLPVETAKAFREFGWPVHQGYGLTETSPVVCSQRYASANAWEECDGSVGPPIPGVELRLDEQSEIWVRGENLMMGYWRDPESNRRRIVDGWLRTGDRGCWRADGSLVILGRIDDVIVLSNGRKVDPMPIELQLMKVPAFQRVILVGNGRPFLVALVEVDIEKLSRCISEEGSDQETSWEEFLLGWIDRLLGDRPKFERPKAIYFLEQGLSQEQEELTIKGTVRRQKVLARFEKQIEALYEKTRLMDGSG